MPMPGKRSKGAKAGKTPAKKAPAAKTPAKKKPTEVSFAANMKGLVEGAPKVSGAFLLNDSNIDQLWSHPTYHVSTRALGLDRALGIPGLPAGRLVEVYAENGAGKSTLLDQVLAETQAMGGVAAILDVEQARDLSYMGTLGVKTEDLLISQAVTMENVFQTAHYIAESARERFGPGVPIVIGWDSVAGTPTNEEYEGGTDDQFRASAAKVIKQNLRTLMSVLARTQVIFLCINQIYKAMGGGKTFFSDADETYGGGGIKYHASIRIALFKQKNIYPRGYVYQEGQPMKDPIGQVTGVKIVKNKLASPNKYRKLGLIYGTGFDNRFTVFEDFVDCGHILQNGSWYQLAPSVFGEANAHKWQGSWFGLADLIAQHENLWPLLVSEYKKLPQSNNG
jgi:recombination protein RecA